ncbi:ribonuclease Y, partial [Candidatus Aerophobetes bacterium]|nr:ribonuclease Y [Candidatus Aerophobetes bacterium]
MAINPNLIYVLLGVVGGWVVATLLSMARARSLLNEAQKKLAQAEEEIKGKRREIELEKREELHRVRAEFEKETRLKREELGKLAKRLTERQETLDRRVEKVEKDSVELLSKERSLQEKKEQIKIFEDKCKRELERVAGISSEEAKKILLDNIKKEAKEEANQIIQKAEREAKEVAGRKARETIAVAIQRLAVDEVVESTVSAVALPNDEMKGRVIGREGRNIRTFEALTGVDLIVDDTPETVVISCFDPLRRKIAEISLQRLISDTRIHPARIEEIVGKAKKDVEEIVKEEGRRATFDMGISDLPSELVNLVGKLKFRTSYGQNVLEHSKEVSYIGGILAAELGADPAQAKRAGLLHDIGKAVDQEVEGPHAVIGSHLVKRSGEDP